ncbi:hypothetical protein A989_17173 [Xanthomonas translucens DAR61454]|nr:hypothetical protein A989_17173 [Xanthomonas translucens DAR61454]
MWCNRSFGYATLQAVEKMLGVAFHNQLDMTFLTVFARLRCGYKYIGKLGLNLRVQMNFGLLHPHGGMWRAIEGLH